MPRKPADLSAAEFNRQIKLQGFAAVGATGGFIDLTRKGEQLQRLEGVREGRGLKRRETLAALLAGRAKRKAADARVDRARAKRERIAAAIAPVAVSPVREGLSGPAAIAQLAEDFVVQSTRSEGVVFSDLLLMGWNAEQIREHEQAARLLAYRRQERVLA